MGRNLFEGHNASIVNYIFQTLIVTYLVLLLVEQIWSGVVSVYLNLNYLLLVVIIAGILDVFSEQETKAKERVTRKDYLFAICLGVLGFAIIKFKTSSLGWLSWAISGIAGVLIVLLSILVLEEDNSEVKKNIGETREFDWRKINKFRVVSVVVLVLLLLSLGLEIFGNFSLFEAIRIVFGSVFVLFVPGFVISWIFFSEGKIDWIERIALSFALSIAVVPLVVFYLNLAGLKINALNSFIVVILIILISLGILRLKRKG